VSATWQALEVELARWREAGRVAEFWWRDDDAALADAALARLLELSARSSVPLALAVVPVEATPALFGALGHTVTVIQHGTDHRNRAASGEKKTEFPRSEPPNEALGRLASARERLAMRAGASFVPVLAPPWNRLRSALLPLICKAGFRGLSQYGARGSEEPVSGLRQVNTHVDLVAWRAGRGFAGEKACLDAAIAHLAAKREGRADAGEATGWLSHHAVHDEAAWVFLERLFEMTLAAPGVRWRSAAELFPGP